MTNSKPFAKNCLFVFALLSSAFAGKGQNLVPNGDFEQYSGCPNSDGQINLCLNWMNPAVYPGPGGSPDYFNSCATNSNYLVPQNTYGFQNAHSGDAYCGILCWRSGFVWREYVEVPLTSSLVSNQCYLLEMYFNLADRSQYTSDGMGAYFSNTAVTGITNFLQLPFTPQIDINIGLNTDTVNWIHITGNFTANGGENYMIIGNFKNDVQTNSLQLPGGFLDCSYFYIDDVSLTPCTGIEEQNNNAITIYPNPVKDELTVNCYSLSGKKEIVITDILGKEIYRNQFLTSGFRLPASNFKEGIYFLEINNGKEIFRKKFLKEQ